MDDVILLEHCNRIEEKLIAEYRVSATASHPVNKGTSRESFIKEFLADHLCSQVSIGKGEIIDCHSKPEIVRNEFDIVIFKNNYPKLKFGGDINGYLIESVLATIEVKSTIDKKGLKQAVGAAVTVKNLSRNVQEALQAGYIPPAVMNFVVAYDGPSNMSTILEWLKEIYTENNLQDNSLYKTHDERKKIISKSIDAIIVLNKGFAFFDNMAIHLDSPIDSNGQKIQWVYANSQSGSLYMLFLLLIQSTCNLQVDWLNLGPYMSSFSPKTNYFSLSASG